MAPIERTSSFWIAGPRLVRCERELVVEDKLSLEVAVGDGVRWWYRAARPKIEPREDGFITSEFPELSLFNPWHLASSLELRSAGRTVCAGRDALAAHGTSQHSGFLHIPTAERYELAVDAERGVILKHDALFDERSLEVYEVIDIAFDADLDPGLFRVEGAPEHVNIARVSGRGRESMCSFCGLTRSQVMSLIAGDGACICDGCIDLCKEIIDEQRLVPG